MRHSWEEGGKRGRPFRRTQAGPGPVPWPGDKVRVTRAPWAVLLQRGAGLQQVGSAPWGPVSGSRGALEGWRGTDMLRLKRCSQGRGGGALSLGPWQILRCRGNLCRPGVLHLAPQRRWVRWNWHVGSFCGLRGRKEGDHSGAQAVTGLRPCTPPCGWHEGAAGVAVGGCAVEPGGCLGLWGGLGVASQSVPPREPPQ